MNDKVEIQIPENNLMTIQKALQGLDYFIKQKQLGSKNLLELEKSFQTTDGFELAQMLQQNIEADIVFLEVIRKNLVIKCRHLKLDRDVDPDGNLYCMECNQNL